MTVRTDGTHLVADSLVELHKFAASIGLKREWFQNHRIPHYDLTTHRMGRKAEQAGAVRVTSKEIVLRHWRRTDDPRLTEQRAQVQEQTKGDR
jgi:hypothetical protein